MEIRWIADARTSALYAAAQLLRTLPSENSGQVSLISARGIDQKLVAEFAEPTLRFAEQCAAFEMAPLLLADQLTGLGMEVIGDEQRVQLAIRKISGPQQDNRLTTVVTSWVEDIFNRFLKVYPKVVEELELRFPPLQEQWEARAPGLMFNLKKLLGADFLAEQAEVVLVQPFLGGGGIAHLANNRVSFEAVLANPVVQLPEIVRLAWLLAQLQLDRPHLQEPLPSKRAIQVGALALIPATLAAAYDVELTGPPQIMLPQALQAWHVNERHADILWAWWETFLSDQPSWGIAISALDVMLQTAGEA